MITDIKRYNETKTALEAFTFWQEWIKSQMLSRYSSRTVIPIKQIDKFDDKVCEPSSRGRIICERLGEHSWFNHSMDGAY